jgi:hypothetical protein
VAASIGDPALVPCQRMMSGNLLVDSVRPKWALVRPSENISLMKDYVQPQGTLYGQMGHTSQP